MRPPIILKLAVDDIKGIREDLSEFGAYPPKKFRGSFEKFCINVTNMPLMYSQYEYNVEYRSAVIAYDYIVFYKVDPFDNRVRIYRVLHGKRNIVPMLE